MTRVFSAVEIEEETVRNELCRVRDSLNHDFSPVPERKMHLTLEFFEDIESREINELRKTMDKVDIESFNMEVKGVGCFPSWDYIRVVWAGVESDEIHQLHRQISDHGVKSQDHDFQPHITLFRVRDIDSKTRKKLKRAMRDHQSLGFGSSPVSKVKLFRSEMTAEGSRYHEIHSRKLD